MAAIDAAIFEALWRHTTQIKYAKPNYEGFFEDFFFATNFCRRLILVTRNHFSQNKPSLWEEEPFKN